MLIPPRDHLWREKEPGGPYITSQRLGTPRAPTMCPAPARALARVVPLLKCSPCSIFPSTSAATSQCLKPSSAREPDGPILYQSSASTVHPQERDFTSENLHFPICQIGSIIRPST